tara:strand:- start:4785 stop:5015 length:231 start_codon:yes stop_codon:yes gene_type:complete
MIEFFTALVIYYQVQENTMSAVIWFDSYAKCEKVLRSDALHVIYEDKKDIHIACDKTHVMSKALRPRARPESVSNG